ncbi:MAG TPA: SpoIIE family protein phosphatase [Acidimicrobiia bacterium]|nr:SpoIIE family protein phosphatase [Acidimicrobiia bacterium]
MLLRRRLVILFAVVVLLVVALAGLARVLVRDRDEASDRARGADVASEQVARLDAAFVDQESGERGYLITGQPEFLDPYRNGQLAEKRLLADLAARERAVPALRPAIDEVAAAARRWRARAAEPEIALRRAGDADSALASVESGVGKQLFDELRDSATRLAATVDVEARAADDARSDSRRALTLLLVGVGIVALVGAAVAAWLIRRWVTRPIDALVDDVRRVRDGDLDAPIRAEGPPEIAELGAVIDSMRRRINSSRILAERAREAIEQDASVVLALRSQLEPDIGDLPKGWTIAAQLRAAEGVAAGDCYDLAHVGADRIGLVVVDIAGHGAKEGILALRCKELIRASLAAGVSPGAAIAVAADQLGDMGPEVFLTTFVAVVDTVDGAVQYANAGHPPAFVCSDGVDHELGPTGPLVGLFAGIWTTESAAMTPGDTLCAYTDGLIEVRNAERAFFGPERLLDLIRGSRCDEAPAIVKRVLDEVELFAPGRLHDDATIVVLCRPDRSGLSQQR